MKKVPEKLSCYKQYEQIKSVLTTVVYDSLTLDKFEIDWKKND